MDPITITTTCMGAAKALYTLVVSSVELHEKACGLVANHAVLANCTMGWYVTLQRLKCIYLALETRLQQVEKNIFLVQFRLCTDQLQQLHGMVQSHKMNHKKDWISYFIRERSAVDQRDQLNILIETFHRSIQLVRNGLDPHNLIKVEEPDYQVGLGTFTLVPQPDYVNIPDVAGNRRNSAWNKMNPWSEKQQRKKDEKLLTLALAGTDIPKLIDLCQKGADANFQTEDGSTAMHIAAAAGHLTTIKVLVKSGGDLTIADQEGNTPLHKAVIAHSEELVRFIVDQASFTAINAQNQEGATALLCASPQIATLLLERGASPNVQDLTGLTPCIRAATLCDDETMKSLLSHGANGDKKDSSGKAPYWLVCNAFNMQREKQCLTILQLLYAYGFACHDSVHSDRKMTPVHIAAQSGHADLLRTVLRHGASTAARNVAGDTAFHLVVRSGSSALVRELTPFDMSVETRTSTGSTALHLAAASGDIEMLQAVLKHKPNIEAKTIEGDTALHQVMRKRQLNLLQAILEHNPDVEKKTSSGNTALHLAAALGDIELLQAVLKHNPDVEAKTLDGDTALHMIVRRAHINLLKAMMLHQPAINVKTEGGDTSLHLAVKHERFLQCELLVQNGAAIDVYDASGYSPLHIAITKKNLRITRLLLPRQQDIEHHTAKGLTSLHIAVQQGNEEILEEVLRYSPNVDATTPEGEGALHLVLRSGRLNILRSLLRYKPNIDLAQSTTKHTPLHAAVQRGDVEMLEELLRLGPRLDISTKQGVTPLYMAVNQERADVVRLLLSYRADPELVLPDFVPLNLAIVKGNELIVRTLLQGGAHADFQAGCGPTPLHFAATCKSVGILTTLVRSLKPVQPATVLDDKGRSPLHYIISMPEAVTLLSGCNVATLRVKDNFGNTPFHNAVTRATLPVVKAFCECGFLVTEQNSSSLTAAEFLCADRAAWKKASPISISERLEVLRFLLAKGGASTLKCHNGLKQWKDDAIQEKIIQVLNGEKTWGETITSTASWLAAGLLTATTVIGVAALGGKRALPKT